MDYCTEDGATTLAEKIQVYWGERGYSRVKANIAPVEGFSDGRAFYALKSNLVAGLPKSAATSRDRRAGERPTRCGKQLRIPLSSGNVLVVVERPGPAYETVNYAFTKQPRSQTAATSLLAN